jgi:hypothetical protein
MVFLFSMPPVKREGLDNDCHDICELRRRGEVHYVDGVALRQPGREDCMDDICIALQTWIAGGWYCRQRELLNKFRFEPTELLKQQFRNASARSKPC